MLEKYPNQIESKLDTLTTNIANLDTDVANLDADVTNLDADVANLDADVVAVKADTAAILVDTANIQPKIGTPTDTDLSTDIANVQAAVDAISFGAGFEITDVDRFPFAGFAELRLKDGKSTVYDATTAGFWTAFARHGAVGNVTTSNTYATIVNLTSSSGWMGNIVSCALYYFSGSTTLHIKLTLDGTAYEITTGSVAATGTADRLVIGPSFPGEPSTTGAGAGIGDDLSSDFDAAQIASIPWHDDGVVISPSHAWSRGFPMLRFESSLKVEVKTSNYQTANNEHKAGVTYILDKWATV